MRFKTSAGLVRVNVSSTLWPAGRSVVPETVGVWSSVVKVAPPSIVIVGTGAATVKVWVKVPVLPAPSETVAITVWSLLFSSPSRIRLHAPPAAGSGWSAWVTPSMVTVTALGDTTLVTPEIAGFEVAEEEAAPLLIDTLGGAEYKSLAANAIAPAVVSNRPFTRLPMPTVIAALANDVPTNVVPAPIPRPPLISQKTFLACAPPVSTISVLAPSPRAPPTWKIKTASGWP